MSKKFLMMTAQQTLQVRHMVTAFLVWSPWWLLVTLLVACYGLVFFADWIPLPVSVATSQPQQVVFGAMILKAWEQWFGDEQTDEK